MTADGLTINKTCKIIRVLPFALFSFCMFGARAEVTVVDGPNEILYGFPLFWHWRGVNSLSRMFLPMALLADFLFYFMCWCLLAKIPFFNRILETLPKPAAAASWIISVAIAFVIACLLLFPGHSYVYSMFAVWPSWIDTIARYEFHWIIPEYF